jgi:hypothetical protein
MLVHRPLTRRKIQPRSPSMAKRRVSAPSTERLRLLEFDDYSPTPSPWLPSAMRVILPILRPMLGSEGILHS